MGWFFSRGFQFSFTFVIQRISNTILFYVCESILAINHKLSFFVTMFIYQTGFGWFICFPWGVLTTIWCGLQRQERHQWLATSVSRLQVNQHSSGPSIPVPLSSPSASRPPYFRGGRAAWNSDLRKRVRDSCIKEPKEQMPYTMCMSFVEMHQTWPMGLCSPRRELSPMPWDHPRKTERKTWLEVESVFMFAVRDSGQSAYLPLHLKLYTCQMWAKVSSSVLHGSEDEHRGKPLLCVSGLVSVRSDLIYIIFSGPSDISHSPLQSPGFETKPLPFI